MREYTTYHNVFIHNVMGSFFRSIADFFRTEWFLRTNDIIISTYEKALEHYRQRKKEAGENWNPKYPFIVFDPGYDFEPEQYEGKFLHGYPHFRQDIGTYMYEPKIYEDDNVVISPVLNRYQGTFEVTIWCSSIYELLDTRLLAFQFFGGIGRVIIPKSVNGYFVLPNELKAYTYENPYTGESYQLDWNNSKCENRLIKTISKDPSDLYFTFPFSIEPFIKLSGISDGSDKYGGSGDDIGEHRLSISIEWEAALPTHLIICAEKFPIRCHKIDIDIGSGFQYVMESEFEGINILAPHEIMVSYMDNDDSNYIRKDLVYKDNFIYIFTQDDYELVNNDAILPTEKSIFIPIPETIENCELLKVYCKFGQLRRDYHWRLTPLNQIELLGFNLRGLEKDDLITIMIYEEDPGTLIK